MKVRDVVIIGAGISGLVAAANLAAYGLDVVVAEKGAAPGGKLEPVCIGGELLDAGPTVLTMRWVLDEILSEIGIEADDLLTLTPLDVLARHAWSQSEWLDLYADRERSADAIGVFAGLSAARGYLEFSKESDRLYRILESAFIKSARPSLPGLISNVASIGDLLRIKPFTSLWRELGRYFTDPRLRQLFARYATYCGSSPFAAPATLMLIAAVEQAGVWRVGGGMRRIAEVLCNAAVQRGAELCLSCHAEAILREGGRVAGIRTSDGEVIASRSVLSAVDAAAISAGLLGRGVSKAVPKSAVAQRSLSAMTWTMRTAVRGAGLSHHNVFFGPDYSGEFSDLARGRLVRQPTVYVCAPDRSGRPGVSERERLLCIVNAPASVKGTGPDIREVLRCEEETFQRMRDCGVEIERVPELTVMRTPRDYAAMFPGTGGAIYGTAQHGWRAAFLRPGVRTRIPGLFLAGGSIHPGPGLPMAALSGRSAAAAVHAHLASQIRFHRVATPGGMSTASATAAAKPSR